jgi:hypothetical protein
MNSATEIIVPHYDPTCPAPPDVLWLREAFNWAVLPAETPETDEYGRVCCSCGRPSCPSPGKHPNCSFKHHTGPLPLEDLRKYLAGRQGKNSCVLTGARSGILVGDVDPRNGGTLDALWERGWPQNTPIAQSGGLGWHVYAACPPEGLPSVDAYAPGIEVKGNGKLVILPPSLHPSGRRYAWLEGHEPWSVGLSPLPAATLASLAALVAQRPAQVERPPSAVEATVGVTLDGPELSAAQLRRARRQAHAAVKTAIHRVREDGWGRHDAGNTLASRLVNLWLPGDEVDAFALRYQEAVRWG